MTTNFSDAPQAQGSATVYQFPPRGRFAASRAGEALQHGSNVLPAPIKVACGSGWYHDEAIQAEQSGSTR